LFDEERARTNRPQRRDDELLAEDDAGPHDAEDEPS
jgi:hypothetical protein